MDYLRINEVQLKQNSINISLEVYYIGKGFYLMYKDYEFTLVKSEIIIDDKLYKLIFPLDVPFNIIEIRGNEDLDNTFIKTSRGDLIRTNIEDSIGGEIIETINFIEKNNSNHYYEFVNEWLEVAEVINV